MILEKLDLVDYIFELVDGDDILETYRRADHTSSCMTGTDFSKQERLNFYRTVKDLKLLRLVTCDNRKIVGRALVWTGKDINNQTVRVMDRIYVSGEEPSKLFKSCWSKFADVSKDSARNIICTFNVKSDWNKLRKTGLTSFPYLDTFKHTNLTKGLISNKPLIATK